MATLSSGEYIIQLMNAVGYDFVVPGNHEFDYGMTKALENLNALDATVLSCNFIDLKTQKPVFDGYKVVSYGDTKVAFVGVCTPETYTKSTPTYFQDANGKLHLQLLRGQALRHCPGLPLTPPSPRARTMSSPSATWA